MSGSLRTRKSENQTFENKTERKVANKSFFNPRPGIGNSYSLLFDAAAATAQNTTLVSISALTFQVALSFLPKTKPKIKSNKKPTPEFILGGRYKQTKIKNDDGDFSS